MLDTSAPLQPIDGDERERDIAFETLRADIVRCRLAPGTNLTERALVERYRLGKASIRAALVRLGERNWVWPMARRGYVVRAMTLRDIADAIDLRRILEPAAARLAAGQADANRLRQLDAVCGAGFVPGDLASEAAFLQAHRQLHAAIVQASGNRRLAEDHRHLWDEIERIIHHTGLLRARAATLCHDHAALVGALARRRGDEAAALALEEIYELHRLIVDAVLRSPTVLAPAAGTIATKSKESHTGLRA